MMNNLRHGSHWLYDKLTGDPFFLGSTHLSILLSEKKTRYNYYTFLVQRKFNYMFDARIFLIF